MKSFDAFIQKQFQMCEEPTFRTKIEEAYKFYEQDITKMLDREKGIYYAMVREKGEKMDWREEKIDFDADHLVYVKGVLSKPATRILNQSTGDISAKAIDNWIMKMKRAIQLTQLNDFYYDFPKYLQGLELTVDKLEEIKIHFSLKKKKRGNPNLKKDLTIADEARIIQYANELLRKDPDKYKAKKGATVSQLLKHDVNDRLKKDIPKISVHKVSRLLRKHYSLISE